MKVVKYEHTIKMANHTETETPKVQSIVSERIFQEKSILIA